MGLGAKLRLVVGEVYAQADGTLFVVERDEAILVQVKHEE